MGAQRLSLSSSALAGRVKKFDTYEQGRPIYRPPQRATQQVKPISSAVSKKPAQTASAFRAPAPAKKASSQNLNLKQSTPLRPKRSKSTLFQPAQKYKPSTPNLRSATSQTKAQSKLHPKPDQAVQNLAMQAVQSTPATKKSIIADQFQQAAVSSTSKRKRSKLQSAVNVLAVSVFLFASAVSVQTLLTNKQTQEVLGAQEQTQSEDPQGVAQGTGRDPAEEKVPDEAIVSYQVAAELPRYLRIPSIDVFARIKHTGIDSEGAVDAPANIHDVSWYDRSAKPGNEIGASLLLGHVQGWSGPGIFRNIEKLQPGDRFSVEKGSGEVIEYEVTRGQEIPVDQVNMAQILSAENAGAHDMKLMTCSGDYDSQTESYNSRYVIYAKTVF